MWRYDALKCAVISIYNNRLSYSSWSIFHIFLLWLRGYVGRIWGPQFPCAPNMESTQLSQLIDLVFFTQPPTRLWRVVAPLLVISRLAAPRRLAVACNNGAGCASICRARGALDQPARGQLEGVQDHGTDRPGTGNEGGWQAGKRHAARWPSHACALHPAWRRLFLVSSQWAPCRTWNRCRFQVIGLAAGEPDFDTPAPIVAAGVAALTSGVTRYTARHCLRPAPCAYAACVKAVPEGCGLTGTGQPGHGGAAGRHLPQAGG